MDIILKILMILGILILAILGLILLILVIVLAAPITYKADASANEGDISAHVLVKWLLFIKVPVSFENKELKYSVKIFGIQIFPKVEKAVKSKKSEETEKTVVQVSKTDESSGAGPVAGEKSVISEEVKSETIEKTVDVKEKTTEPVQKEVVAEDVKTEADEKVKVDVKTSETSEETANSEKEKESIWVKLDKLVEKIKNVWGICEQEKDEVEKFFKRKSTKYTFEVLKKDILKLLNHIRPRKLTGDVEFGFDDPATTGYALAALSAFYGLYCENLEVSPDFSRKVLNGNLKLSGRIHLGYIVYIGLDVYLRKRVRMFIKNVIALKDITLENVDKIKNQFISGDTAEAEI